MERSALGVDMFQRDEMLQQRIATIESYIYRESIDLNDIRCSESVGTPEIESRFDVSEAKPSFNDKNWRKIKAGDAWGKKPDSLAWFRIPFTIPKEFAGKTLDIWIDVGGMGSGGFRSECLAYVDGKIKQGIDRNHFHLRLCEKATAGKKHLLAVEAFTGVHLTNHSFVAVKLMVVDPATQDLYYDAKVAYDGMKRMDENSRERARLEDVLNETFHLIDMSFADVPLSEGEIYGNPYKFIIPNFDNHYTTSDAFYESVEKAGRYLKREFYSKHKSPTADEKVVMVGHAHIDVAWLWRLAHSRKKCGRTFSTVLELMDRYPDFNFFQSQPLLYQYTKENYPELYKRIKERVKDKRWEANGAAWVEMDTNVPSGESLVRQFLFGKRFLKEEFGYDSRVMWL
ncbi:MAG: hypothetical protein HRT89_08385, partial [Lentisphaeria bacterium]|nr:hypothetical protein [Lentisphaeria bacterium]